MPVMPLRFPLFRKDPQELANGLVCLGWVTEAKLIVDLVGISPTDSVDGDVTGCFEICQNRKCATLRDTDHDCNIAYPNIWGSTNTD